MEPTRTSLRARRAATLAAVVATAALVIPSAAGAAVTGTTVANTAATLTGDAAADNIVIGFNGTNLTHNLGIATGFESDIDFNSAAAGEQTLLATATLTINAGDGDDNIVGSRNADHLIGGAGSDRITGFTGDDDIEGGLGNDLFIWNNGDNNDTNDGEDGNDEQQINGRNTTDDMTVQNIAGGRVRFDRVAPGPFFVDMGTVERLTINSQAGDDKLVTSPGVTLPLTIDAGPGIDDITTGDAGDLVQGGEGVDTLNSGAGGDRLLGNPGNDVMNAGSGDDTLVWNNGDGTDEMNGQDGLDRIEDNLGAADDVSKIRVDNGKVRYDRVNAPFGLNVATSEVFELNTFGGNDTLDVDPGVGALIAIVADAGSGNDRFNGGDESDTFFGGLGDDILEPGAGFDAVDGQDGNDVLKVRDNTGDLARGGPGTDSAVADAADVLTEMESTDVTPVPVIDTKATAIRVVSKKITSKIKKGIYTAKVRVECPATEAGGCKGRLSLLTAKSVRINRVRVPTALLASKSVTLNTGQRKTVSLKLPRGVGRIANRNRTLSLRAETVSRDASGNLATRSSKLSVKLKRK